MKTVQMTLDEDLLKLVDRVVQKTNTTRSAFTRDALRLALKNFRQSKLETRHRQGYQTLPLSEGEFDDWEDEQVWGDD